MIWAEKKKSTIEERYSKWLKEKEELEKVVLNNGFDAASTKAIIQYNEGYFKGYMDALKEETHANND